MARIDSALWAFARSQLRPLLYTFPYKEVGGIVVRSGDKYKAIDHFLAHDASTVDFPEDIIKKSLALGGAIFHTHPPAGCPSKSCRYSPPSGLDVQMSMLASYHERAPISQVIVDLRGVYLLKVTLKYMKSVASLGEEEVYDRAGQAAWQANRLAYMVSESENVLKRNALQYYNAQYISWIDTIESYVAQFNKMFRGEVVLAFCPF